MKTLSVFIDESGDFGESDNENSYYLVSFVFHDQLDLIEEITNKLQTSMREAGFIIEYLHTSPIIRREDAFEQFSIDERRKLLYMLLNFYNKCPIRHKTFVIKRSDATDKVALSGLLGREIKRFFTYNYDYLNSFDKIIVYYDNGQSELSAILNVGFSSCFENVVFRKADPRTYRLLQVADFVCTMELLNIKQKEKRLCKFEQLFFYRPQELQKTFLKSIARKRM